MYSRVRMITDITKIKSDARDILKAADGVALPTTAKVLKRIVLDLDQVIAEEHAKSKELRNADK